MRPVATYTLCAIALLLVIEGFMPLVVPDWQSSDVVERARTIAIMGVFCLAVINRFDR
ncbi:MAG: hypothetical protein K9G48_12685 [Reyranella sp.]|nr:hypothetical protein [Reyranella sp.]